MMSAIVKEGTVVSQEQITSNLLVIKIGAPEIATIARPGQFVHVRLLENRLRRPFSIFAVTGECIELLYRVVGIGTNHMMALSRGNVIDLIGPLGSAFSVPVPEERLLLVGGGVGVAPLSFFASYYTSVNIAAVLGFNSERETMLVKNFAAAKAQTAIVTSDGSVGVKGMATDLVPALLPKIDRLLACGPAEMLAKIATLAARGKIPCEVALERTMACGIGACLGCVVPSTDPVHPYLRVCTEGPVVDAKKVWWERI